ncbi:hypothetical protein ACR79B_20720 [Sphingobacterium spiritivorum]|uniref:hypothetical protein n=1 Tax=Sphingobacterium spiritivorum TaxID=258 RepID=UPI003DA3DD21
MSVTAKIDIDISGFSRGINKAKAEADSFSRTSIAGLNNSLAALKRNLDNATDTKNIVRFNIRIKETQKELERLKSLGLDASNSLNAIGKATFSTDKSLAGLNNSMGSANGVAIEFTRIIQDAPFGIMGVGNNITRLAEVFGTLKEQTGSTSAALKASFASIFSTGNLVSLGISAIVTGFTIYQMQAQKSGKETEKLKDRYDELIKSLDNVSTAMYNAQKSAGAELAELKALYTITTDVTKSTDERRRAAKDLIDQYPALFSKFTTEQIMLGKAKTAYDEVGKSIIATARAQAAYGRISDKSAQQLAIDETNRGLREQLTILDANIKRRESMVKVGSSAGAVSEAIESGNVSKVNALYDQRNKLMKEHETNLLDRAKLQEDINELESFAIVNQAKSIDLSEKAAKSNNKLAEQQKKLNAELDAFILAGRDQTLLITSIETIEVKYNEIYSTLSKIKDLDPFKKLLIDGLRYQESLEALSVSVKQSIEKINDTSIGNNLIRSDGISIPLTLDVEGFNNNANQYISNIAVVGKKAAEALNQEFGKLLETGLENTIIGMSEALGEALVNGGSLIESMGKVLLGSMGDILVQLGTMAIQTGIGIEAVKNALATLQGPLAIAAGVALIALGSVFKAGAKKLGNSMGSSGGYNGGGGSFSQASGIPQLKGALFNNDRQLVEFVVQGDSLRGWQKQSNERGQRLT